jgi:hypothetical protein
MFVIARPALIWDQEYSYPGNLPRFSQASRYPVRVVRVGLMPRPLLRSSPTPDGTGRSRRFGNVPQLQNSHEPVLVIGGVIWPCSSFPIAV